MLVYPQKQLHVFLILYFVGLSLHFVLAALCSLQVACSHPFGGIDFQNDWCLPLFCLTAVESRLCSVLASPSLLWVACYDRSGYGAVVLAH